jgi:hypothetical protein
LQPLFSVRERLPLVCMCGCVCEGVWRGGGRAHRLGRCGRPLEKDRACVWLRVGGRLCTLVVLARFCFSAVRSGRCSMRLRGRGSRRRVCGMRWGRQVGRIAAVLCERRSLLKPQQHLLQRQHTSAYVSIRQHTRRCSASGVRPLLKPPQHLLQRSHASAFLYFGTTTPLWYD